MIAAIILAQALLQGTGTSVGVTLAVDDAGARAVLRDVLERQLSPTKVIGSCRDSFACLEVVAVPIVTGKKSSGWAVAARLSRKLSFSPDWPEEIRLQTKSKPGTMDIIEDSTSFGDLACVPCEEEKTQLKRELDALQGFAESRYEEVGGLGLWVGPSQETFLRQVGMELASQVRNVLSVAGGKP